MAINRRDLTFLIASLALLRPNRAAAAPPARRIRLGFATKTINGQALQTFLPAPLGYAQKTGFSFDMSRLGSLTNVLFALERGQIDLGTVTPAFNLPLAAKGELPPVVAFYEYTYPYKWDIAVLPDSPISSYADLKGKRIGVSNFGTTDYPVTRAVLKELIGIDPDKDASWAATGEGISAGVALQRQAIDALAYYDVGFGQIENAGIKLRFLPRPPHLPMVGGLYIGAMRETLQNNRSACVAYGRCIAMATEYISANPRAAVAAFLQTYPEAAPKGATPTEAIDQVLATLQRRIALYRPPYAGFKLGQIAAAEWEAEAHLDKLAVPDIGALYTNDLIDEINDFDRDLIIAAAKNQKA